jgi:hypothetical protein
MAVLQETAERLIGGAYWAFWQTVDNLSVHQCQNYAWLAGLYSMSGDGDRARECLVQSLDFLNSEEASTAAPVLKEQFVQQMENMFPILAEEPEVQALRQEIMKECERKPKYDRIDQSRGGRGPPPLLRLYPRDKRICAALSRIGPIACGACAAVWPTMGTKPRLWPRLSVGWRTRHELDLQRLADLPPEQVAPLLIPEHPQIIAVILTQLQSETSGAILDHLPEHLRADICQRIAGVESVSPEALDGLNRIVGRVAFWEQAREVGGVEVVADILNRSGSSTASAVLDALEKEDAELAGALRRLSLGQALERVRDFVLAMKNANDLHRVLDALRGELERLGLSLTGLQIHAMDHQEGTLQAIGASGREEEPLIMADVAPRYIEQWRNGRRYHLRRV